jgi:predicted pyridoxine 5'-phosphate oxidase superfamily flavin-nucleotide-binding protein
MTKIEGVCREVCEATEFVTIVTTGDDGPHVVGNWGDYMRVLGIKENMIVFPAGRYQQTEKNLRRNNRVQLLVASRKVQGTRSPGQGCLIIGTAEILSSGDIVDAVKAIFPWARGAMVIHVKDVQTQL